MPKPSEDAMRHMTGQGMETPMPATQMDVEEMMRMHAKPTDKAPMPAPQAKKSGT